MCNWTPDTDMTRWEESQLLEYYEQIYLRSTEAQYQEYLKEINMNNFEPCCPQCLSPAIATQTKLKGKECIVSFECVVCYHKFQQRFPRDKSEDKSNDVQTR